MIYANFTIFPQIFLIFEFKNAAIEILSISHINTIFAISIFDNDFID